MDKIITQVGSLPHREIWDAVQYSLRHDIPFLPELINNGENMFSYIKRPGNLLCLDLFKREVNERGYSYVKVQCVGPATMIVNGGYSHNDAVSRCRDHIGAILDGLNAREIILFLDEPALINADFSYRDLWNVVFDGYKVIRGIHNCGEMDWQEIFGAEIDIVSFPQSIKVHSTITNYRDNKRIAWGVKRSSRVDKFRDGDLLTPPCGLASFSVKKCERTLDDLLFVKRKVLESQKPI